MDKIMLQERRKFTRYRGNPKVKVTVEGDEGNWSTGIALNISCNGTYLLASSILFEEGTAVFRLPGGEVIRAGCRLIDGGREGGQTMGVTFTQALSEREVNLLKAEGYEE